jgi:hypothetical protein
LWIHRLLKFMKFFISAHVILFSLLCDLVFSEDSVCGDLESSDVTILKARGPSGVFVLLFLINFPLVKKHPPCHGNLLKCLELCVAQFDWYRWIIYTFLRLCVLSLLSVGFH